MRFVTGVTRALIGGGGGGGSEGGGGRTQIHESRRYSNASTILHKIY